MRLSVRVAPRASRRKVERGPDGTLKAYLTQAPAEGKANKALIEALAEFFGVKKSGITIVSGLTSRNKIVEIAQPVASRAKQPAETEKRASSQ